MKLTETTVALLLALMLLVMSLGVSLVVVFLRIFDWSVMFPTDVGLAFAAFLFLRFVALKPKQDVKSKQI